MALVHLAVRDRRAFRDFDRTALAKLAARLHTPQLTQLLSIDPFAIVSDRVARDVCAAVWAELGEAPCVVRPLDWREGCRAGLAAHWGIAAQAGERIDRLAERDTLLAMNIDPTITEIPRDAWGRFAGVHTLYERAYYRARVNWQIAGIHAGRCTIRNRYLEA